MTEPYRAKIDMKSNTVVMTYRSLPTMKSWAYLTHSIDAPAFVVGAMVYAGFQNLQFSGYVTQINVDARTGLTDVIVRLVNCCDNLCVCS